jgi:hypothetical protein
MDDSLIEMRERKWVECRPNVVLVNDTGPITLVLVPVMRRVRLLCVPVLRVGLRVRLLRIGLLRVAVLSVRPIISVGTGVAVGAVTVGAVLICVHILLSVRTCA